MITPPSPAPLRFDEPRLRMSVPGRLIVRIVGYASYLILSAATFTLLFSDIPWLFWAGALLLLGLLDRALHRKLPDESLESVLGRPDGNLARALAPAAYAILERAYDRNVFGRRPFFLEFALESMRRPEIKDGLRRLDIEPEEFRAKAEELLREAADGSMTAGARFAAAEHLVRAAAGVAQGTHGEMIRLVDLFAALPGVADPALGRLLTAFGIRETDLRQVFLFASLRENLGGFRRLPRGVGGVRAQKVRHRIMNRAWTARPTPTLDRVSTDLTDLARAGGIGFLVGHEAEYRRLLDTLGRAERPNALLIGDAGVGKEAIVGHLAAALAADDVPRALFDKRLVSLELSALVAGAEGPELTARLTAIVREIEMAGNVILYIPEIHNLLHTSGAAYLSAADALLPVVMRNDSFPTIGAAYPREFKQIIEPRSDFTGAFDVIHVDEVSEAEAERIVIAVALLLEAKTGVTVSFGAIRSAVALGKKYLRPKLLPSSAEELIREAVGEAQARGERLVGVERVTAIAERKSRVPIRPSTGDAAKKLLDLERIIHNRLIGQDEAVAAVANALREYRSGLVRPSGPIASFLFVGPTGVGKTELAKALAEVEFGEGALIRFDMTEYREAGSITRFIGSADGSIPGALAEAVRERPYAVILLDEFEKAHPNILNLFLQVLDEGRLTDGLSRTVDLTNTIIIATSNAKGDLMHEALREGQAIAAIGEYVKAKLTDIFAPELINRFSKVIVFRNLNPEELAKVARIQLADLVKLAEDRGIALAVDDSAATLIAKRGYDPAFGARPIRRVIDEEIRALLAEALLREEAGRGSRLRLTAENGEFHLVADER